MAISYPALKTELLTDPRGYGYAPLRTAGDHVGLAALLNTVRDGTNGAVIAIQRADITGQEIREAVDSRDVVAATNPLLGALASSIFSAASNRLKDAAGVDTRVSANLQRMLTNTNGSLTRLQAIATRNGSRAEELFGVNTFLTYTDIGQALAS